MPTTMSEAEERELIEIAQRLATDNPVGIQAMQRVVNDNMGLIGGALKRWHVPPAQCDEGRSFAEEALIRAVYSFDLERGVKFSTWATLKIRRAIDHSRRFLRWHGIASFSQVGIEGESFTYDAPDQDPDPDLAFSDNDLARACEILEDWAASKVFKLSRYSDILRCRFGIDGSVTSHEKIAARLGITRERVRQLETKGLECFHREWRKRKESFACWFLPERQVNMSRLEAASSCLSSPSVAAW